MDGVDAVAAVGVAFESMESCRADVIASWVSEAAGGLDGSTPFVGLVRAIGRVAREFDGIPLVLAIGWAAALPEEVLSVCVAQSVVSARAIGSVATARSLPPASLPSGSLTAGLELTETGDGLDWLTAFPFPFLAFLPTGVGLAAGECVAEAIWRKCPSGADTAMEGVPSLATAPSSTAAGLSAGSSGGASEAEKCTAVGDLDPPEFAPELLLPLPPSALPKLKLLPALVGVPGSAPLPPTPSPSTFPPTCCICICCCCCAILIPCTTLCRLRTCAGADAACEAWGARARERR